MELKEYLEYTINTFSKNNFECLISEDKATKLYNFSKLLVETNKITNLTAITDEKDIILKHFIDSASIAKHIPANATVIDVGCGAGFPSLPLAILRDDISVTSIDSTGKKIDFVQYAAAKLDLRNISAITARAENFVKETRESFDVCTSRAVARLNILSELCVPYIKTGGYFIAMKSSKMSEEYKEASSGIEKLGCRLNSSESLTLSDATETILREIFVFKKFSKTPQEFPRNYSQIVKKPL